MFNLQSAAVIALLCLGGVTFGHGGHRRRQTPPALNPQLTNTLPTNGGPTLYYNGSGPVPPSQIEDSVYNEIIAIIANGSAFNTSCTQCIAATEIMHFAAITQPVSTVVNVLIRLCNTIKFSIYAATCEQEFSGIGDIGPYYAQLFAKMSFATQDMQAWCWYQGVCDIPAVVEIDESQYFTPKPASANVVPTPSGETINVLHISDWHLDPRYDIGSEADCSQYLCCRVQSTNTKKGTTSMNATVPASRFGYLYCDSPADLALSAFDTMPQFFSKSEVSFTIFTGDIVSHDNDDQLSRAYIEYEETVTYQTFKAQMGAIPIYPTLGNHDSLPEAFNTPNTFNPNSSLQSNLLSWNYDLLSSLWQESGWINASTAQYASNHYGAYAVDTALGLRIISLNSDFWYVDNVFNYANFTNPDPSGVLSFLASELAVAEAAGLRVWIICHVLSGYDGTNGLPNPTALLYSIVRRFSPTTIAAVFFGHTHEDQLQLFYDYNPSSLKNGTQIRNTTDINYNAPLTVGFIGPSITPLTGNNAGYQLYQVDSKTFEIMNTQTYIANVSESLTWSTPVWQFEYDMRTEYNVNGTWPATSPLNATFFNDVTYSMLTNQTIVEQYNLLETKSSVVTKNCSTKACAEQKVCYIRSGSAALGLACPQDSGPF
ncbi:hypothetical protein MMC18_002591 [Xylographa bjoerkii]|nr:hypothetical protein [Xylographa bjoerkii]